MIERRPAAPHGPKGNLVCDLDGVVYRGDTAIVGAGEALQSLDESGYRIIFATNNSSKTDDAVAAKISRLSGYQATTGQVVTSARAAASMLAGRPERVYVVGGEGLTTAFREAGHEIASTGSQASVVAVGFDLDLSYERLREATKALHAGARFIASNLDTTFPAAENDLWPGAGSMVAALEAASGRKAEPAGKPYEPMKRLIAERFADGPVFVVGDRPDTDLALGAHAGWTTVLTLSGVTPAAAADHADADIIVETLAALPAALSAF
jgi:HAD superfamily hydrolase (TIGR01450 family)